MSFSISIPDHILFEDEFILVLNKPAGLMVEPDRNNHPNLLQQVRNYIKTLRPPGDEDYAQHIHRLDRPVSGVIVFAKQRAVLKNLSEQFAERRVKKYYQAVTKTEPESRKGTLTNWLRKEKKKAIIYDHEIEYSEKVLLDYEVTNFSEDRFLWSIQLHTGKYHQIRAQLAHIGCPVIGDEFYGSTIHYKTNAIELHASRLLFSHPVTGKEMSVEASSEFK